METKLSKAVIRKKPYPENLIYAMLHESDFKMPESITGDIKAGVEYALSTLPLREQKIVHGYYLAGKKTSELAKEFSVTSNRIIQIDNRIMRKLREPKRLQFILYGVSGAIDEARKVAYEKGFSDGIAEGINRITKKYKERKGPEEWTILLYELPLENLNLSVRAFNALHRVGCRKFGDVVRLEENDIKEIQGLGRNTGREIAKMIEGFGMPCTWWSALYGHKYDEK